MNPDPTIHQHINPLKEKSTMIRKFLPPLLVLLAMLAGGMFTSQVDASQPAATTNDPLGPVRACATGNDYAVDAYALPASTIVAVSQLAGRPDLEAANLTPVEQDQRARLVVQTMGSAALPCGWAYAGCATTSSGSGTLCYAPPTEALGPNDTPVLVRTSVADCVITATNSCSQTWYCSTPVSAAIANNNGVVPYNLAVLGGVKALCSKAVGVAPVAAPTPTAPTPTTAPVASPRPAFTG